jgi:primosomal protein N'
MQTPRFYRKARGQSFVKSLHSITIEWTCPVRSSGHGLKVVKYNHENWSKILQPNFEARFVDRGLLRTGMRLYTVVPIAKTIGKETLTYFGSGSISLGALVSIPLRKKNVHAIVVESQDIGESKSLIKSSSYSLRKISRVVNGSFLGAAFLNAATKTARFHATSTGSVLSSLLPKLILENATKIKHPQSRENLHKKEILVIQDTDEDRFAHYKSFIRSEFAKKSSVYFCLPTQEDIRRAKNILEKGIEQYTCILHSNISKKEWREALTLINDEKHPVLIIGTAPFLGSGRTDLGSIILDRENSRSYRTQSRPYLDQRVFIKYFAHAQGLSLVLGDLVLSLETLWQQKNDEYAEFSPLKFRTLSPAENVLIDMKLKKGMQEEKFTILSPELEALIGITKEKNENLFIFCGRKGLAPVTVCGDCGLVVTCRRCGAPVTLYRRKNENIFLCNKCGEERATTEKCKNCDSWKLDTLGIGAEGVEEEIKKKFPDLAVFRMDKDNTENPKKALETIRKFETTPGSVLIGTELALFYLGKNIENVAVASIDALFSVPDFRINEKIFYLLLTMRARADKVFLVQTRNADEKLFDYALKGNLTDYYKEEIEERERFKYPPFTVFVKMTIEGRPAGVQKEIEKVANFLNEWNPMQFESMNLSSRGNTLMHILFRFTPSDWPNEKFLEKVYALPPHVAVRVDPESLL